MSLTLEPAALDRVRRLLSDSRAAVLDFTRRLVESGGRPLRKG